VPLSNSSHLLTSHEPHGPAVLAAEGDTAPVLSHHSRTSATRRGDDLLEDLPRPHGQSLVSALSLVTQASLQVRETSIVFSSPTLGLTLIPCESPGPPHPFPSSRLNLSCRLPSNYRIGAGPSSRAISSPSHRAQNTELCGSLTAGDIVSKVNGSAVGSLTFDGPPPLPSFLVWPDLSKTLSESSSICPGRLLFILSRSVRASGQVQLTFSDVGLSRNQIKRREGLRCLSVGASQRLEGRRDGGFSLGLLARGF
jgi:hypothetical protein